jgi:hypothetical protein
MSFTTTTITRRFYKLKVKARPVPGRMKAPEIRKGHGGENSKRIPLPPLFQSSLAFPVRVASRSRWWRNWKWVSLSLLSLALSAALCGALYYWGKTSMGAQRHSPQRQDAVAMVAPAIAPGFNMRPMRLSSGSRSAYGEARQLPADSGSGIARSGSESGGNVSDRQTRQSTSDDDVRAMLDSGGKLLLPTDVAGSCSVGDGGIKDLGACLARNGARAE